MTVINTRITVTPDGAISVAEPLPAGEYSATITAIAHPRRSILDLPTHDGHWDDRISLSREDMYGDDGR